MFSMGISETNGDTFWNFEKVPGLLVILRNQIVPIFVGNVTNQQMYSIWQVSCRFLDMT